MTNFTKNVLKYLLIILLLAILAYLSYMFFVNKKHIKKINNNIISHQDQKIKKDIEPKQSATSTPVLLNNEEKKKYGINTDEPVYLEMIEGNKDFPGRLPRLIFSPELRAEMIASSSKNINTKTDKK